MSKAPAYQEYANDYLANEAIQLMSLEEEGAFNRLKRYCWREGSIPGDLTMLSRLCKGASTTVLAVVVRCFQPHPGDPTRLILLELEEQHAKHAEWRAKSSEGGKKSAEARSKAKGGSTVVEAPQAGCSNTSSSSSSSNCTLPTEDKEQTTLTLTPSGIHAPSTFILLPLNDGSMFSISEHHVASWEELYQSIDVRQELKNYRGHFDAKPKERKTKTGILASVNHWLRNAQDRAKGHGNARINSGTKADATAANGTRAFARALGALHERTGTHG